MSESSFAGRRRAIEKFALAYGNAIHTKKAHVSIANVYLCGRAIDGSSGFADGCKCVGGFSSYSWRATGRDADDDRRGVQADDVWGR